MKRNDLIRHLEHHGCELLREGGNHSVYINRKARRSSAVPRSLKALWPVGLRECEVSVYPNVGLVERGYQRPFEQLRRGRDLVMRWRGADEQPIGLNEDVRHRCSNVAGMCRSNLTTREGWQDVFPERVAQLLWQFPDRLAGKVFQPPLYEPFERRSLRWRRLLP